MRDVLFNKQDFTATRTIDAPSQPLGAESARLRLDLFGLTSNNVTYAAMGEGVIPYWEFFPGPAGWGKVPVWGFGTVVASNVPGVEEGRRYYGYFPLAESVDVTPAKVSLRGFFDSVAHRAEKPSVYNYYADVAADPAYDPAFEPEQALLRPLFPSGWWAADFVHRMRPSSVVISSASSKTALSMAHKLKQLGVRHLIGLTSQRNVKYLTSTELFSQMMPYDDADRITLETPATYVDFLGREELTTRIHRALGSALTHSVLMGATDWKAKLGGVVPPSGAIAGPQPQVFSVPHYLVERLKVDRELAATMVRDMRAFYGASRKYLSIRRLSGAEAALEGWARLVGGEVPSDEGMVCSF
jgi:hypothetical protein